MTSRYLWIMLTAFLISCSSSDNSDGEITATDKFVGGLTADEALSQCQEEQVDSFSNFDSMDVIQSSVLYLVPPDNPKHEVHFDFYHEDFDGKNKYTAMCVFDRTGYITTMKSEPK